MRNKKIVEINRFDNFNKNEEGVHATTCYNYHPTNSLNNSKGVACAMFPKSETNKSEKELYISQAGITKINGIAYFKQYQATGNFTTYRLLVYGEDKKVYINQMIDNSYELFWLYNLEFNTAPIILTYKKDDTDACILASDDQMKVWETGYSPYTINDVPIITSMCMNDNVLFCTIKNPAFKVWYATDLDIKNIGNISNFSGFISLEDELGDARKIVTFNEDVYVFRDYGITKINYLKKEISTAQVYVSNTLIYPNTVSVCGNNILFMTKGGLHSFNGVKVTKTNIELLHDFPIENAGAVASSLGEKYYLALNLNFKDGKQILCENDCVNNVLLIIDTLDFSYQIIRGVDIKSLLPVKTPVFEKMLVIFNSGPVNKIGEVTSSSKLMDDNLPKFWQSDSLVKTLNTKLFTKLSVKADVGVVFKLKYDDKEVYFTTTKSGVNNFMFKIICKDLSLEISSSNESAIVSNVVLEYYEY